MLELCSVQRNAKRENKLSNPFITFQDMLIMNCKKGDNLKNGPGRVMVTWHCTFPSRQQSKR